MTAGAARREFHQHALAVLRPCTQVARIEAETWRARETLALRCPHLHGLQRLHVVARAPDGRLARHRGVGTRVDPLHPGHGTDRSTDADELATRTADPALAGEQHGARFACTRAIFAQRDAEALAILSLHRKLAGRGLPHFGHLARIEAAGGGRHSLRQYRRRRPQEQQRPPGQ
jgi:hypothetical protein